MKTTSTSAKNGLHCYNGIQRANDVLREIPLIKDGSVSAAYGAEVIAEAKFIRGVLHMELAKCFRNAPYVDETVTYAAGNFDVPNPGPIWDKIETDFNAAMTALPTTQPNVGRANKYAAEALLAEAYMFDDLTGGKHSYAKAVPLLTDVITSGITSGRCVILHWLLITKTTTMPALTMALKRFSRFR